MEHQNRGKIVGGMFRETLLFMIMGILVSTLGTLIDGIVIGRLMGVEYMAAYGLVTPMFAVFSALGNVFSSGSQALCAEYMGSGQVEKAARTFSNALVCVEIVAVAVMVISFLFAQPISAFLGASGESAYLLPYVKNYFLGLSVGLPFMVGVSALNPVMQLDGDRGRAFLSTLVMMGVNVAGDLMNVYLFRGGMLGMALATSFSYACAFVVLLLHFCKKDAMLHLRFVRPDMKEGKQIVALGLPGAVSILCTTARSYSMNRILLAIADSTAIAAFSARNSLSSFLTSISLGIGMTTLLIAGIVLGEEDRSNVRNLLKTALGYAVVGMGAVAVLTFLAAPWLASMFMSGGNVQAHALAVRCIRFYTLSMPLSALVYVIMNFLQGTKNIKLAHVVCILDNFGFVVLLAAVLGFIMGTDGVWLSFVLAEIAMCLTLTVITACRNRRFPRDILDFAFLPADFGAKDGDVLEMSIGSRKEVISLSREAEEFCRQHGADMRRTMLIALTVEEMAGNIVAYGFSDGKKHSIELRLVKKDGDFVVSIRDNCRPFNPRKQLELTNPEDPVSNIGIRMISKTAKEFRYVNTMKVNHLIVRV